MCWKSYQDIMVTLLWVTSLPYVTLQGQSKVEPMLSTFLFLFMKFGQKMKANQELMAIAPCTSLLSPSQARLMLHGLNELVGFAQCFDNLTQLGSPQKKEPQLRECSHQIGLWANLSGIFLIKD